MRQKIFLLAVAAAGILAGCAQRPPTPSASPTPSPATTPRPAANTTGLPLSVPDGFAIGTFAKNLGKPRVLAVDPAGTLLVSIPASGKVVALPDKNGDGVADETVTVISGLNQPHGLAFRCLPAPELTEIACQLYIAESNQVTVSPYDVGSHRVFDKKKKIIDLPDGGNHFTRTLLFHNDRLLIAVGSSCNVCRETDWRRAVILSANPDGSDLKVFARGLRNAVFLTTHPVTGAVWATEMGRDHLGDDLPPEEINIIEDGKNYGWPVCFGDNIHDTDFDKNTYIRNPCQEPTETAPHLTLGAHVAPLGLAFVPQEWPADYRLDLLVAEHGSWNRSAKDGYKIVRYPLDAQGNPTGQAEDFIIGWLRPDGTVLGRPVDIRTLPGGVMYISDDKAGVIYRISYPGARSPSPPSLTSCRPTGCSGQVCADEDVITTCEFRAEYACYKSARCERQPDGHCGWTETAELTRCRQRAKVKPITG